MKPSEPDADRRTCAGRLISFETGDRFGGALYLYMVEHYEIVDPNLPYADRFRTLGYTLSISTEDETICDEFEVTGADMLGMAARLADRASEALAAEAKP